MKANYPVWRSMLFVPAHVDRFVESAHKRGADAYILDLEDSVPLAQKVLARSKLQSAGATVSQSGAAVVVRINNDTTLLADDVSSAIGPQVRALMVPKVSSAEFIQELSDTIAKVEKDRGLTIGHTLVIAQIESVHSLTQMDAIAGSSPRVMGMILGSEDFSLSAGMEPIEQTLFGPNQQLVFACRRAGIYPFGFPGSISQFRDLDAFRKTIRLARNMGFVGSYAIHPDQVRVMNEEFLPPAEEVQHARELLAAYEESKKQGRGAFEFKGRMVDAPVVLRAEDIVRRAARQTDL
jgi:citrate lyase subunit beta/citryl-CoA lyase